MLLLVSRYVCWWNVFRDLTHWIHLRFYPLHTLIITNLCVWCCRLPGIVGGYNKLARSFHWTAEGERSFRWRTLRWHKESVRWWCWSGCLRGRNKRLLQFIWQSESCCCCMYRDIPVRTLKLTDYSVWDRPQMMCRFELGFVNVDHFLLVIDGWCKESLRDPNQLGVSPELLLLLHSFNGFFPGKLGKPATER